MDGGAIVINRIRIDNAWQAENAKESHSPTSGWKSMIASMKRKMSRFASRVDSSRTSAVTTALCGPTGMVWNRKSNQRTTTCGKDFQSCPCM